MTAHILETRIPKLSPSLPPQSRRALISDLCAPSSPPTQPGISLSAPLKAQTFLLGCSVHQHYPHVLSKYPSPSSAALHGPPAPHLISTSLSSSSLRKPEEDNNNNPELFLFFLPSFPSQEHWGDGPAVIRSPWCSRFSPSSGYFSVVQWGSDGGMSWEDVKGLSQCNVSSQRTEAQPLHDIQKAFNPNLFQNSGSHLGNGVQVNSLTFS